VVKLPRASRWLHHHRLWAFWLVASVGLFGPWLWARAPRVGLPPPAMPCTVASVHDGDTLRVVCHGKRRQIRVYCIDAPELSQRPWGQASRDHLRATAGRAVSVRPHNTDRYGRLVAEVFAGGVNLGLEQVRAGQAVEYRKYCGVPAYRRAQAQARAARRGVWRRRGAQRRPWEWRHR